MMPKVIFGDCFQDLRGLLLFNNDFDATEIKRMYVLENNTIDFVRAWQGHKIEQRWFSVIYGSFKIKLIEVDNWKNPCYDLPILEYILKSETFDILHMPNGYVSSIQALEENSKLLVMSNYHQGEINDDIRYAPNHFTI